MGIPDKPELRISTIINVAHYKTGLFPSKTTAERNESGFTSGLATGTVVWDSTLGQLIVWDGTNWHLNVFSDQNNITTIPGALNTKGYASGNEPSNGIAAGSIIYDTTNNKLKIYNGSAWETITSA